MKCHAVPKQFRSSLKQHISAMVLLGAIAAGNALAASVGVVPGAQWTAKTPAEVGLEQSQLDALAQSIGGSGCVVRYGYLVFSWGDPSQRRDVEAASEPIFSHFLLRALEDGKIPTAGESVFRLDSRITPLNEPIFFKDRNITWRDLARQTACYGVREFPTTAFCSNGYQSALLSELLFQKVYRASWSTVDSQVLQPILTSPLQCQDAPSLNAPGGRPGRLAISPRDFARIGLLYLNRGRWGGRSLLGARYAEAAISDPVSPVPPRTKGASAQMIAGQWSISTNEVAAEGCDHPNCYSWLWNINGRESTGRLHWPDAPSDTFGAFGARGKYALVVMPRLGLVASWNDSSVNSLTAQNAALKALRSAAVGSGVSPAPVLTAAASPAASLKPVAPKPKKSLAPVNSVQKTASNVGAAKPVAPRIEVVPVSESRSVPKGSGGVATLQLE